MNVLEDRSLSGGSRKHWSNTVQCTGGYAFIAIEISNLEHILKSQFPIMLAVFSVPSRCIVSSFHTGQ